VVGLLDSWVAPPVETARSQVDQNPPVLVLQVKQAQKSPHFTGGLCLLLFTLFLVNDNLIIVLQKVVHIEFVRYSIFLNPYMDYLGVTGWVFLYYFPLFCGFHYVWGEMGAPPFGGVYPFGD